MSSSLGNAKNADEKEAQDIPPVPIPIPIPAPMQAPIAAPTASPCHDSKEPVPTSGSDLFKSVSYLVKEQFDYIQQLENVNVNKTIMLQNLKSATDYNRMLKEVAEKMVSERDGIIKQMQWKIDELIKIQQKDLEEKKILCAEIMKLEAEKTEAIKTKLTKSQVRDLLLERDSIVTKLRKEVRKLRDEKDHLEKAQNELSIESRSELEKIFKKINQSSRITTFLNQSATEIERNVTSMQKELEDLKSQIQTNSLPKS